MKKLILLAKSHDSDFRIVNRFDVPLLYRSLAGKA